MEESCVKQVHFSKLFFLLLFMQSRNQKPEKMFCHKLNVLEIIPKKTTVSNTGTQLLELWKY